MMVTAKRIPVPDPMAPMKSAKMQRAPMQIPPKVAAVWMYRLSWLIIAVSLQPSIMRSWSINYFVISRGLCPLMSIHNLEKKAHEHMTKA